jgi:hypothetical protein
MANHTRYGNGEKLKGKCEGAGYGVNGQDHAGDSSPIECRAFPPAWFTLPPIQNVSRGILAQSTCKPLARIALHFTISFRCYQKLP